MANYNKVILVGNLTRDPQLKYLPSQMAVTEFGLAVNHKYKTKTGESKEDVLFVDCSIFGQGAEIVSKYCQKGKQLLVEGRLKYDSWEDKQGGGKRSKHSVVVDTFQFLGGRQDGEERDSSPARDKAASAPGDGPLQQEPPSFESEKDDLPF